MRVPRGGYPFWYAENFGVCWVLTNESFFSTLVSRSFEVKGTGEVADDRRPPKAEGGKSEHLSNISRPRVVPNGNRPAPILLYVPTGLNDESRKAASLSTPPVLDRRVLRLVRDRASATETILPRTYPSNQLSSLSFGKRSRLRLSTVRTRQFSVRIGAGQR